MHYTLNFGDLLPYAQFFTDGLALTAKIALIVTIFGTLLGILGAVVRNSPKHGVLYHLWTGYVELIRNTPFIIQLFFIFFGLPQLGLHFSADSAAVLALIINLGAYNTEIVRAGLAVTSPGQWEAARCLGLTRRQTYIHVVLPPAIRKIYPALVGQCVLVMLGSAVISQISCEDLTYAASYVQNLAGPDANIIFGAMYDDTNSDAATITVIATGLDDATAREASVEGTKKAKEEAKAKMDEKKPYKNGKFSKRPYGGKKFDNFKKPYRKDGKKSFSKPSRQQTLSAFRSYSANTVFSRYITSFQSNYITFI